jgi:NADPH:quinone reductase-like Zn-dependent oxidoreductase
MKAIVCDRYGPPADVLRFTDIDAPVVARDELLVRVHAATVNPADWHLVRGQPYIARLSYGMRKPRSRVPGCDVAGQVVAVGPDVTTLHCGDEVFGSPFPSCGAFAKRVRVVEDRLALKPSKISSKNAGVRECGVSARTRAAARARARGRQRRSTYLQSPGLRLAVSPRSRCG